MNPGSHPPASQRPSGVRWRFSAMAGVHEGWRGSSRSHVPKYLSPHAARQPECRQPARGAALYWVVQRKAIEVLAEHPDDVAVEHRLPRTLSRRRQDIACKTRCIATRQSCSSSPRRPIQHQRVSPLSPGAWASLSHNSEMRGTAPRKHIAPLFLRWSFRSGIQGIGLENSGEVLGRAGKRDRRPQSPHTERGASQAVGKRLRAVI